MSFDSMLGIVEKVLSFDSLPDVDAVLINVTNSLLTEEDVNLIANHLGVAVLNHQWADLLEEVVEIILSDTDFQAYLSTCVRLKIIVNRWLNSQ